MAIRIITDTSSDFDLAQAQALGVGLVSMTINVGDESYSDGIDITRSDFYDMLLSDEVVLKTSQPTPSDFIRLFEEARDSGDDVIAILISGALSGTVQSALTAREMAGRGHIHIVDSRCASVGIQLLVSEALRMRDEGCCAEDIVDYLDSLKRRIRIYLGIDTLKYLYRGGRLSKVEAGLGTLANVHPILCLQDGGLGVHSKCMGKKKTIRRIAEIVQELPPDERFPVRFLYSHNPENCLALMKHFPDAAPGDMQEIGATLAAHAGPGVFAAVVVTGESEI